MTSIPRVYTKVGYLAAIAAAIRRAEKKAVAERVHPSDHRGRDRVAFWDAAVICLTSLHERVCRISLDDPLWASPLAGPWDTVVQRAQSVTKEEAYGRALLAHAHLLAPPADDGNVVILARRRG